MKIRQLVNVIILIIIFTFAKSYLYSQTNYKLTGKIIDRNTEKPLPGATVRIGDSKIGTITDRDGNFSIDEIKNPQIKIIVSFIGYQSDSTDYDFKWKKVSNLIIKLSPSAIKTKEIMVTGEAQGATKAFIEQNKAENIKNVVSAEQIAQFPDINAAEAMQRIPGITLQRDQGEGRYVQLRGTPPELTNFNINGEQIPSPEGNVRFVGMDIISADQIEFIEVTKVLTPDMDADGIGGTVNIITKKATSIVPEINAIIAGGYNNLRETDNYDLQFSYGQRYNKFGFNMNASYYLNNQGSDNMEFKYAKGPFWGSTGSGKDNYYVQYREAQLRHYTITRKRIGLSGTIDYQFDENNNIYLRGMYNRFSDKEIRRRKIYNLNDAISENYYLNSNVDHEVRDRLKEQEIASVNLGAVNKLGFMDIDYEISYSVAEESDPDYLTARFGSTGQYIAIKFDKTDKFMPIATFPDTNNAFNATAYQNFELDELLMQDISIIDNNKSARINFKFPYVLNENNRGFIKFGGKYRNKIKTRDITANDYGAYFTTSTVYPGTGPELNLLTIVDGFSDPNLLDNNYLIDYMPSAGRMRDFFQYNSQFFIYDRTKTKTQSYGEDYNVEENISSAYLMFRHEISNLMILAGLRYEKTNLDYQGILIETSRGKFKSLDSLYDTRTHEFLLPQIQMKYTIFYNFNLRLAATKTYSRPNFEDVLPYRAQDRDEVKYGNPELKYPESLNLDFLAEYYGENNSLFSGGVFYKKIDNFIFYYKRFAHEGEDPSDYGLVEIEKAINGLNANVFGVELQAQSKLKFLPSFFSDFGVFFNYTFTNSEAYINKRLPANYSNAVVIFGKDDLSLFSTTSEQEQIQLPGQAKHTFNAAVFFDNGIIYARLSANYHDDFLYSLGADKDLDEYYQESLHLDFTASYSLTQNIKLNVDMINLTNAPLKYYLGIKERLTQQEYYSWWGRFGLKL
ncbi:MAG: hypothetical protein QG635_256, partial [Bacteroidota bacterium]|nr:hypothetical protein [Bacteroidota bacterium]